MWAGIRATLLLVAICSTSAVTPMDKVIQLLKDLQATVDKEGRKEAIQYDKYACFCKHQAGYKKAAIEKSRERIEVLDADIKDLNSNINSLNNDIRELGSAIAKLEANIKSATEKRNEDHAGYLASAKDYNEAIASCNEGIENLKGSKEDMSEAKLNLAQLKTAVVNAKPGQLPEAMKKALALAKTVSHSAQDASIATEQNPAKFQFQGNEIIATIQKLMTNFKEGKKDLDMAEMSAQNAFDKKVLGYNNQVTFKNKEKNEKTTLFEAKTAEKNEAEQSRDTEDKDKKSDEAFLKTLISSCEQKAKDWDQRSKSRADEMAALAEATSTLENGAMNQYNVNKKLVGLVGVSAKDPISKVVAPVSAPKPVIQVVPKEKSGKKAESEKKAKTAQSFLQIRSVENSQASALQRALAHLDSVASHIRSPVLAAMALKVQLKGDHFSNVRSLIKDLMGKLEADAKAEASTKGFCDKAMKKAMYNRDEGSLHIEEQDGIIARKSSLADDKADEIQGLSEDIAQLNKDILEAEELRTSEKADNAEAVEEAKAGGAAVKSALATLNKYYKSALLQTSYKPPNSDRDGTTVDDAAPETFAGEYKGAGDSAKGILGTLDVIQTDFERTVTQTEKEEKAAAAEHKKFLKDANADITDKSKSKTEAQKAKEDAEQAVVAAQDDLYDAEQLRDSALAELEKLQPMCVDGEETYEERVVKRKNEIAALKEATQLLDDWQK